MVLQAEEVLDLLLESVNAPGSLVSVNAAGTAIACGISRVPLGRVITTPGWAEDALFAQSGAPAVVSSCRRPGPFLGGSLPTCRKCRAAVFDRIVF